MLALIINVQLRAGRVDQRNAELPQDEFAQQIYELTRQKFA
jgi:hypothetical protein